MAPDQTEVLNLLVQYGCRESAARWMLRYSGTKLAPGENLLKNLELLAKHVDLNALPNDDRLLSFLKRDCAVNANRAQIPEQLDFPQELRDEYYANPLEWSLDLGAAAPAEEGLRLLTRDEVLIHSIVCKMFTHRIGATGERIREICRRLSEINTDPEGLSAYLEENYHVLFSYYADVPGCVDELVALVGREGALRVLIDNPLLPRELSRYDCAIDRERNLQKLKKKLFPDDPGIQDVPLNEIEKMLRLQELEADVAAKAEIRIAMAVIFDAVGMIPEETMAYIDRNALPPGENVSLMSAINLLRRHGGRYSLFFPQVENDQEARLYALKIARELLGRTR